MRARGAKTRGVEVRRLQMFEENKLADVLAVRMLGKPKMQEGCQILVLRESTLSKVC